MAQSAALRRMIAPVRLGAAWETPYASKCSPLTPQSASGKLATIFKLTHYLISPLLVSPARNRIPSVRTRHH